MANVSPKFARTITLLAAFFCMQFAVPASAERIKDLGQFQGLRANQLTGYGLVVGLAGTGDDSLDYATLAMKGAVSRFGLTLPAGVNPSLVDGLRELLVELNKKQGGSFVVIEHNMDFVMKLCHRIVCMVEGRVLAVGKPEEIQNNREVLEAYLGN